MSLIYFLLLYIFPCRLKHAAKLAAENGVLALTDGTSPVLSLPKPARKPSTPGAKRGRPKGSLNKAKRGNRNGNANVGNRRPISPSADSEVPLPEYDDDKDYSASPVKIETFEDAASTTTTTTTASSRRSSRRSAANPISYNEDLISSFIDESAVDDCWGRGGGGRGRRGLESRFNGEAENFATNSLDDEVKIKSEPVLTLEEFNEQYQRQQQLRLFNDATPTSQSVFAVDPVGQVVKTEDVDLTDSFPPNGNADATPSLSTVTPNLSAVTSSSLAAVSHAIMNGNDMGATLAGRKPFKCNDCDARFSHRRLLSEHLNTFHRLSGTLKPDVVAPRKEVAPTPSNGMDDGEVVFEGIHGNGVDDGEAPGLSEFKIEECKPAVLDDDLPNYANGDEVDYGDYEEEEEEEMGNDAAAASNYPKDAPQSVQLVKNTGALKKAVSKRPKTTVAKRTTKNGGKTKRSKAGRPLKPINYAHPDADCDLSGPPAHPCLQCGLWFITADHLDLHKSFVHEALQTFMCCHCPESFGYFHELDKHIKIQHGGDGEKEPVSARDVVETCHCPYEECADIDFKTGLHRESHISSVHIGQRYPCPKCLVKAYRSIGGVKKHLEKCQGDKMQMKCSECAEIVAQGDLQNHFELNHPEKETSESKVVLPPYFPPSFYDRFYGVHRRRVIKTTCDICGENVVGLKKHLMSVCQEQG